MCVSSPTQRPGILQLSDILLSVNSTQHGCRNMPAAPAKLAPFFESKLQILIFENLSIPTPNTQIGCLLFTVYILCNNIHYDHDRILTKINLAGSAKNISAAMVHSK